MRVPAFLVFVFVLTAAQAALPPKQQPRPVPDVVKLFRGQRLAVDPNLPSTLVLGTRTRGLQRSTDGAAHWSPVRTFPAMPLNGIGITAVAFDERSGVKGRPTPVIFAGVADPFGNLFWTRDEGRSWKPVAGSPAGLYPVSARFGPDGWLYLGYVGFDGVHGGAQWALNPRTGNWRAIAVR